MKILSVLLCIAFLCTPAMSQDDDWGLPGVATQAVSLGFTVNVYEGMTWIILGDEALLLSDDGVGGIEKAGGGGPVLVPITIASDAFITAWLSGTDGIIVITVPQDGETPMEQAQRHKLRVDAMKAVSPPMTG